MEEYKSKFTLGKVLVFMSLLITVPIAMYVVITLGRVVIDRLFG